eukprot:8119251-Lingulodinium_polyedra.AAC.1
MEVAMPTGRGSHHATNPGGTIGVLRLMCQQMGQAQGLGSKVTGHRLLIMTIPRRLIRRRSYSLFRAAFFTAILAGQGRRRSRQ